MNQKVEYLKLKNLVLWTENPRDPIDGKVKDQDIVDKAINDKHAKWTLKKLAKQMGNYYDLSELPTVVYHGKKPIVYDGNRRIILGKIQHKLVKVDKEYKSVDFPDIPLEIPCNVCSEEIALQNVLRKHSDSGSWSPLDRDIFLHRFMNQPKSIFLKIEDATSLISSNPHMNQGYVKKEILNNDKLNELGIDFGSNELLSKHNKTQTKKILSDLSSKVKDKVITTRRHRGEVYKILDKENRDTITRNEQNKLKSSSASFSKSKAKPTPRQTPRSKKYVPEIFGGKLYLKAGEPSDIYRDIVDLYNIFLDKKHLLSPSFPSLIRMALRLLSESAAKSKGKKIEKYVNTYFANAKKKLTQDQKTTLSTQNVKKDTVVQLLHVGAHNYSASKNMDQSIAVSIILGAILTISHGK